jgi:cysteinyl-tRNA synthetase
MDAGERVGPGRLGEMLHGLGLETLLAAEEDAPEELQRLAAERDEARAARDFERADQIRDRLAESGWEIRDTPDGARLVRRS